MQRGRCGLRGLPGLGRRPRHEHPADRRRRSNRSGCDVTRGRSAGALGRRRWRCVRVRPRQGSHRMVLGEERRGAARTRSRVDAFVRCLPVRPEAGEGRRTPEHRAPRRWRRLRLRPRHREVRLVLGFERKGPTRTHGHRFELQASQGHPAHRGGLGGRRACVRDHDRPAGARTTARRSTRATPAFKSSRGPSPVFPSSLESRSVRMRSAERNPMGASSAGAPIIVARSVTISNRPRRSATASLTTESRNTCKPSRTRSRSTR